MRRSFTLHSILLTLLLTGITLTSDARRFYMAPTGNDNNNGSITAPFKTLLKVWSVIAAGDTVYLRGGTYQFNTAQYLQGKNGNATAGRINIWAYPGEKPNLTRSSTYNAATQQDLIYFEGNYFHWKGIEISWFDQKPGDYAWPAFRAGFTSNSIFEEIDYHHNGAGMSIRGNSNNNLFLNCDFHHNQDPYSSSPYDGADGIDLHYIAAGNTNTVRNCRAWWNADDGFDCWDNNGYVLFENCWSFYNGYIPGTFTPAGNGSGIKLGSTANYPNTLLRTVQHCIVFKNRSYGIVENAAICKSDIFNNVVAQHGDYGYWFGSWGTNVATLKNNIGWNNPQNARLSVHDIHNHNSWNGGVTVNAADFLSVDDAQLLLPRRPDGNLPDINFLSLVPNSDLIDAGINVGLPFNALAPDISAQETGSSVPGNLPPVVNAGNNQSVILPLAIVTLTGSATDPDGTIASTQWTKISGPAGITISTPLLPVTLVVGLVAGTFEFELLAIDNQGAVGRDTVTVTVSPLFPTNQPPVANAGPNQNITLPLNSITVTGVGTDPDGTIASYAWRKVAGPGAFNIVNPNQAQTVIDNLSQGTYRFELKVTDNQGAIDLDTMRVIVHAAPPNQGPSANAGPNHTITLPTNSVTATGSGSDPDGTINVYQWAKITGPSQFNIVSPTQAQTVINNLVQGTYTFSLTVTDDQGGVAADTMSVTVNAAPPPPNQLPNANAGPDHNITLPTNSVTATGSGTDPDGTIASFQWTKINGPAQGTIVSPTQAQTAINNLAQGTYRFELRVTDNQGGIDRDTMTVTVNAAPPPPNQLPVANAGPDHNITLPDNSVIAIGGGTDPDGIITAYQWTKISGPSQFAVGSPAQPQTGISNLVQGTYHFELRVTDNQGATDTDTMIINVNAAVPPPNQLPVANAGLNHVITLPVSSVAASGSGTDPDGTITAYQWTKVSGPAANIMFPTQAQTVIDNLIQGVYEFELMVTDNQGATDRDTMMVTVLPEGAPVNQLPVANAGADHNITLPVNTITAMGSGSDPDGTITSFEWIKISGPTQHTILFPSQAQTVINNLVQGTYRFELRVTDNQGAQDRDTMTVVVNAAVPPPNQLPVANAGPDHSITLPASSVTAIGSGTDPDGIITAYQWTKISGPGQFAILFPTQPQTVINNLVQGVYQFELRVTDNQGAIDRDTMVVTVSPPPNQAPVANAGTDKNITLPVNSVTQTGSGTDPDGTIVSYQWSRVSGPTQYVIISPLLPQTVINNLVQGVYRFELLVTDNQGATDRDTMTITVGAAPPPNQVPVANAGPDHTLTLPLNNITANGSGSDPDGSIVAYQWTKIAGPAQYAILFPTQPQTVINNLVQGVYQFELRVTDNDGATDRDTMTVTVNAGPPPPPNQAPVANAGADHTITLPVNTVTVLGSGSDPDGTISAYQWTKIAGPTQFSILFPTQGQTVINNLTQGVYRFELRVTDNQGASDRDTMTITVNPAPPPPNQPPVAVAGADTSITLPLNHIIINGAGVDNDGNIVSYNWIKLSGPVQYIITDPSQAHTEFRDLVEGVYEFELTVTDDDGAIDRDTIVLTVKQNPNMASTAMLFPNPATDNLNIRIEAVTYANKTMIQVLNISGVIVFQKEVMRTQQMVIIPLDVAKLPRGAYFVKVGLDLNNAVTLPFIKQ